MTSPVRFTLDEHLPCGGQAISRETLLNTVSRSGECSEGGKIEQGWGESVNRGMFRQEGKQRCQYGGSLKRIIIIKKTALPYDPAIPLLGSRENCNATPVFLVALFTIGRTREQSKFSPPTDE